MMKKRPDGSMFPNPIVEFFAGVNRYVAVVLFVVLAGVSGCSQTADFEEFDANVGIVSDGSSIYAVGNRTKTQSTVAKFDGNTGEMVWSTTIGYTRNGGLISSDGYLWVAVSEYVDPAGWVGGDVDPNRLFKISLDTGQITDEIAVPGETSFPRIEIDGELWLPNGDERLFELVNIETGELTDTFRVKTDAFGEFAVTDVARTPAIIGDDLWFADGGFPSLFRISISKRELIDVIEIEEEYGFNVDGTLLPKAEYRDGLLWIAESPRRENLADKFVYSLNPETLELSEPIPHYESPYGTLETDNYLFDPTAENEITQIDNTTGETIQTLEGNNPRFLIGDKLWLEGLTFVTINN